MFGEKGNIFSGIDSAPEVDTPKIYFDGEGDYLAEIVDASTGTSKNPKQLNQPYAAHKFRILESSQFGEDEPVAVGEDVSLVKFLTNQWAMRDVKALIAAVIGCPQGEVTEEIAEQFYANNGAAVKGKKLRIKCRNRKAKDGRVFTNSYFESVPSQ